MAEQTFEVERLPNGLSAVLVRKPHYLSTSARLTVNSGALHEPEGAHGSAHFLEHICSQGTEALPSEAEVYRYAEEHELSQDAATTRTFTTYKTDGYDLDPVIFAITQLAFRPTLTDESLERERRPIIEELRDHTSVPYFPTVIEHARATRGDLFARTIGGSIEDVERITPESLRGFHARNYRFGNAVLVVCSPEPVEKQRECVEAMTSVTEVDLDGEPANLELPEFNPFKLDASLQHVDLPPDAPTSVTIQYGIPEIKTMNERYQYGLTGMVLSKRVFRHLRGDLALCYEAGADVTSLSDLHFGRNRNWSHLTLSTALDGKDSITALEALYRVVHEPLPAAVFESTLSTMRHYEDRVLESNPAQMANCIRDMLAQYRRDRISLEEVKGFTGRVTLEELRETHQELVATKPLVLATSPDPKVLGRIGEWAASINP